MSVFRPAGVLAGWLAALLLPALPAQAAEPLGAAEALRLARLNHPAREAPAEALEIAEHEARADRWPAAPTLELEQEGQPGEAGGVRERRAGLVQALPAPPVWWLERRLSGARLDEARLEAAALGVEFERSVREAHLDAWRAAVLDSLLQSHAELAETWAGQLERLAEAGLRPPLEARQARAEALDARLARDASRVDAELARRRLAAGVGGLDDRPLSEPPLESVATAGDEPLEARRARAALAGAELERRRAAWSWCPEIEAGAARVLPGDPAEEDAWAFSLSLGLPLLDARAAAERRSSRVRERRARAARDWTAVRGRLEADGLRARLDAGLERLDWMRSERLPLLEDLVRAAQRGWEAGSARSLDVLDARRQALAGRLDALEERTACARAAIELDAACGRTLAGPFAGEPGDDR